MKASQKGLSVVLAVSMMAGVGTSAFAQSVPVENTNAELPKIAICPAAPELESLRGEAVVKSVEDDRLLVTAKDGDVMLNISDETVVIDAETGTPSMVKDLKVGEKVFVYYSGIMTKSLPPQSNAIAVVTGIKKDTKVPQLFTVKKVVSSKDGEVRVLNQEGDLILTLTKDSALSPYKTKQMVGLDDITIGTKMFAWFDAVALSYPGQTTATKAVIYGQSEMPKKMAINGEALDLNGLDIVVKDDHLMVPLRAVSEALGFKVKWDASIGGVRLDNGKVQTKVILGEDKYYKESSEAIGLTQETALGAAPEAIEGNTYVPADLFALLFSNEDAVTISGDTLCISNQ